MSQQHVEVVQGAVAINPGHLWAPSVGEELIGLLEHAALDDHGKELVRKQALAVLGHTLQPTGEGEARRTGLVVGYVQSGKTLSFTSVMALANDNHIPLVILFSGTKDNLHKQTHGRLEVDLRARRKDGSPWLLFSNPEPDGPAVQEIATVLRAGQLGVSANPLLRSFQRDQRTVVLTVMKNSNRLGKTRRLIEMLAEEGVDLAAIPVLVVDDEADQAGLNTRAGDEEDASATYAAIRALRSVLPRHSYLQYTATPQAPLLLNLLDTLSPDFVAVLNTGRGYTGGRYFFQDHAAQFVRTIPTQEAHDALDTADVPPHTLKSALASYLIASLLMAARGVTQSSMLVHPAHTKDQHDKFAKWVRALLATWGEQLATDDDDVRVSLVDDYLRPAYDDLTAGMADPPEFETVVDAVRQVTPQVQVRVVNSGDASDSDIAWDRFPWWILVGGNKLDRGYTVEGLVTTYMPRGAGSGQADTIQQRARFFGYKGKYADWCRAWLIPDAVYIYERYVEHEEALRAELARAAEEAVPLKTWRRRLLIDSALKPCRANVIGLPYVRERVKGDAWARFERLLISAEGVAGNRAVADALLAAVEGSRTSDPRDPRPGDKNQIVALPLGQLVEVLLSQWEHDPLDSATLNTTLLLLRARLDDQPDLQASLFLMDGGRRRQRSLSPTDPSKVNNLFQGRSPMGSDHYPGDQQFHSEDAATVSVQLHRVDVRRTEKEDAFVLDVPALALYVPKSLASDLILGVA